MATILVPSSLRRYSEQHSKISLSARTIGEILMSFAERSPDLRNHLFAGQALRKFVVVCNNGKDIRLLEGMDTPVADADEIQIIASVACG